MAATAHDVQGIVYKNGSAVLMARVVGLSGAPLTQPQAASINYSVFQLDDSEIDFQTPVAGHDDASLAVGAVLFNSLQTDALWDVDATGYNFRHILDAAAGSAFPIAGLAYQARYEIAPTAGPLIVVRFKLRAI
jgi:hypothetical protein